MKLTNTITTLLAASPALAFAPYTTHFRRDTGTCNIAIPSSAGGRKIAIVIDSSGSMSSSDPFDLRITAGRSLNDQLVSAATGSKKADLVTVVDFDDTSTILYPLGPPSAAEPSFSSIDSSGGTYIALGLSTAVAELTKPGNDPTADRSGVVVLTDGEDSDVPTLIAELVAAGQAGIRVSFGFLAPVGTTFDPDLLGAILRTGGTYVSFETADAIQSFLYLLLGNGLTKSDQTSAGGGQPLLPGVTVAKLTAGSTGVGFSYTAVPGESVNFTVESLSSQSLQAELKDGKGVSLAKNSTGAFGEPAVVAYAATTGTDWVLTVGSVNDTAEGVFQVSVLSSLGISACNLTTVPGNGTGGGNGTGTGTGTTGTATPSPTKTGGPFVTAAAGRLGTAGFSVVGVVLAAVFL